MPPADEPAARTDGLDAAQSPQYGEGDDQLARMRSSARAGGMAAGLMGWPIAAWSTTGAASGAGAFFIAAAVGGAVAIAAGLIFIRARDRSTAAPLQQALAASTAGWWRTDATGLVTSVHPGQLAAGMDIGQLNGRALWQPDPDVAALEAIQEAFAARRSFHQVAVRKSDADRPLMLLSGGPVFGTTGELVGFAGTALPAADADPAAENHTSSARVDLEERNRQLGERTRELDNAVRELDSFAYSVSHDLRAPLRVVDGFATIVLEDYGDRGKPLDDVGRDHLRRIVAASQRMNTMIDTLLGLSRMTSRELTRERVDLSQVARELTEDLRAQDAGRSVQFVVNPDLRTDGDSTLLRLVLQNLLGNAYKFTAKNRAARIEFGARPEGSGIAYYVRDNGAGFDMRFAEKMFGLFQRLHSANEFPGTGVGLATVQKIIRRHGGRVWAEAIPAPTEGHGATFFFTLWEQ
jgi:signal transduction histidine kinase